MSIVINKKWRYVKMLNSVEYQREHFTKEIDPETGELKTKRYSKEVTSKVFHGVEPPYIKLYLENVLYLVDIPKSFLNLVHALLKRATYADAEDGLSINLASYTKKKICEELKWKNLQSLNNALNKLCQGMILKRLGTGVYQFNPFLFGRGDWKDIENIRITWEYNKLTGRTFQSFFKYKNDIDEKSMINEKREAKALLENPEQTELFEE